MVLEKLADPITYWLLTALFAVSLFLLLKSWHVNYSFILSLLIPVISLEFILIFIFSLFGITPNFGSYAFSIPFYGTIQITTGVRLMEFLDYIFNFGFFRMFGIPELEAMTNAIIPITNVTAITTIPITVANNTAPMLITLFPDKISPFGILGSVFSSIFNFFVFIYVSADSLVEYVFFFYFFSAAIIITSDMFHGDNRISLATSSLFTGLFFYLLYGLIGASFKSTLIIAAVMFIILYGILATNIQNVKFSALGLAAIPVLAYNIFISDPFFEYKEALPGLQKFSYFFQYGNTFSIIIFLGTLVVSFFLVMEIIAFVVAKFYEAGSKTLKPEWETKQWQLNVQGISFIYTASFAIFYAMHQVAWYIFFPAIVLYTLFKKASGKAIDVAKQHHERSEMRDFLGMEQSDRQPAIQAGKIGKKSGGVDMVLVVIIVFAAVLVLALLWALKIISF